jgi:hypothetical protein
LKTVCADASLSRSFHDVLATRSAELSELCPDPALDRALTLNREVGLAA